MVIYGFIRRAIVLATKNDLCPTCNTMGPHAIVRLVSWIEIFFIPIVPVWSTHTLACGRCGATRKLKRGQVNDALKTGKLPLEHRETFREYANWAFEETGRSPQESELDPIEVNPSRGPWDRYLKLWLLIVPAAFLGLVIVGIMNP